MAGVVHNREMHTEFWRPADVGALPVSQAAECRECGSEFAMGARFCHVCGADRNPASPRVRFSLIPQLRAILKWQKLEQLLGLGRGAAIAFCAGVLFAIASLLVGIVYQAQTTLDWEAIQMWRIEWLLASLVAFAAGILLRKSLKN